MYVVIQIYYASIISLKKCKQVISETGISCKNTYSYSIHILEAYSQLHYLANCSMNSLLST